MFNFHKRRLKLVRNEKAKNHNKKKIIASDEFINVRESTNILKIGGTGTNLFCNNTAARQHSIDLQEKIYIGSDDLLQIEKGQWNHRSEIYGEVGLGMIQIPREWRTHDRTRWIRNKNKTKNRINARKVKELDKNMDCESENQLN